MVVWVPGGRGPNSLSALNPSDLWPKAWERDGTSVLFAVGVLPSLLFQWMSPGYTWVAHNAAGFDAPACERFLPMLKASWYDTAFPARAAGLPGGLDAIGKALCGLGKADNKALRLLCKVHARWSEYAGAMQYQYPVGTSQVWQQMLSYNVQDVLLLRRVYGECVDMGEPEVIAAHIAVNERGVAFDRGLARRLIDLGAETCAENAERLSALTGGELHAGNIRSVPQVKRWLASQGLVVSSLNRQSLERLYADPEGFFGEVPDDVDLGRVVEVLKVRQQAVRITSGKLSRLLATAGSDDRARDVFVYWGAHTGRWSGRGFQPHNFPRGVAELDVERLLTGLSIDTLREAAAACGAQSDDALSTLLRPVLVAAPGSTLVIADYAQVEARCVAWIAGCRSLLADFSDTSRDVYCEMASRIFGRAITKDDAALRFIGKETVLGCGYGMSANKFGARCKLKGIDLAAAGTSADACVDAYRDAYPEIAGRRDGRWRRGGLWKDLGTAVMAAVASGASCVAGRCQFFMAKGHLVCVLPSGRPLVYRNARVEQVVPAYCAVLGLPEVAKPTVVYTSHHGHPASLYGGLMAENVCQAICRDPLAEALVCFQADTVLHVHDELVREVLEVDAERELRATAAFMSTPAPWAQGFPLAVEAFTSPRYVKAPWRGALKCKALEGRIL